MYRRMKDHKSDNQDGQSLVEFSLTLLILIIVLSGIVDLGRVYFAYLALQDAAGEGASYGIIHPNWISSTISADPNNIHYRARNEAPEGVIDLSDADVEVEVYFPTPGNKITVSVTADYHLITPIVQLIAGGSNIRITGTAVQTIVSPAS